MESGVKKARSTACATTSRTTIGRVKFSTGPTPGIEEAVSLRRRMLFTRAKNSLSELFMLTLDVPALSRAMESVLITDRRVLEQMGAAGHARVRARHLIDNEAAKLADLFNGETL